MKRSERIELTQNQFIDYINGLTLREIAVEYGLSHPAIIYRFRKYIHPDYHKLIRQGTISSLKESQKRLPSHKREEVQSWIESNWQEIIDIDSKNGVNFISSKKEQQLSESQTGTVSDYSASFFVIA